MSPPPLLTLREVAERLRVSQTTVRRLVQRGELPHIRLSQSILRFHADDVERLAEERRHSLTPPHGRS